MYAALPFHAAVKEQKTKKKELAKKKPKPFANKYCVVWLFGECWYVHK
jgi:hypothetical protein